MTTTRITTRGAELNQPSPQTGPHRRDGPHPNPAPTGGADRPGMMPGLLAASVRLGDCSARHEFGKVQTVDGWRE